MKLLKEQKCAENAEKTATSDSEKLLTESANYADAGGRQNVLGNTEDALAVALERASAASQWDIVAQITVELQARRLARLGNVVSIDSKRGVRS